ncbi:hypothetical protein HZA99_01855 [Candidatus Woesearchaeota archaeon]|nr:hypothetical protein [Candidatus Woesearchaeota archaeon]
MISLFIRQKQKYLADLNSEIRDKSKKGFIDEEIKELVATINKQEDYYTTSSCSGRILLYTISEDRKKNETEWLFVSHNIVSESEIRIALKKLPKGIIFFRFEPLILHVVCKTMDAAQNLLQICGMCGLKHSGAMTLGKRIIVEIIGNDRLDAPVAKDGKIIITEEGISHYVADANEKMKRNLERIEKINYFFFNKNASIAPRTTNPIMSPPINKGSV